MRQTQHRRGGDSGARSSPLRLAAAVAALLVPVAAVTPASAQPRPAAVAVLSAPDIFSGDSKTPCLYPATSTKILNYFSQVTGKTFNCVLVYNNARPTWPWWTALWVATPPYPYMNMVNWVHAVPGRRLIISQPMVPDDAPANWRQLGAEGAYDAYAKQFARNLVYWGLGNSIIRLGWEANAQSDRESALGTTPTQWHQWAKYWANIATSMSSVPGAKFVFDWTVNQYWQPVPLAEWYPGDKVVDIIGIDAYDSGVYGPALSPQQRWEKLYNEPDGLAAVAAFAHEHGKPLSIPEWGLVPSGSAGGANDDPTYVRGLANFIDTHEVEYESYYYHPGEQGLVYLPQARSSLKVYIDDFGPGAQLRAAGG